MWAPVWERFVRSATLTHRLAWSPRTHQACVSPSVELRNEKIYLPLIHHGGGLLALRTDHPEPSGMPNVRGPYPDGVGPPEPDPPLARHQHKLRVFREIPHRADQRRA